MARKNFATSFFGVAKPEDLIGRILKVSFRSTGDEVSYVLYSKINSFSIDNSELSFPPILYGQGNNTVQISIFEGNEFHISSYRSDWVAVSKDLGRYAQISESGYYYSNPKEKMTRGLTRGKIELI